MTKKTDVGIAFLCAVLLLSIFLFFQRSSTPAAQSSEPDSTGLVTGSTATEKVNVAVQRHEKSDRMDILKPENIRIGAGGTTVLEIEHGLKKVDFLSGETYTEAVLDAQQKGAQGAITLYIVDSQGHPVSAATVKGAFWNHGNKGYGWFSRFRVR
jgi:hypothetical protein